ncbi:glycosyltransferase family 2 protein [Cellulomonas endophytica]|uniref:glycosyltransferase family 2 protein n=1 Tax=Cellulomonas endophytica TaxID=2494735 RepID=UPI0010112C11|nr:glycosyltransferase family 2 protein [Cellulomonas endophytica]
MEQTGDATTVDRATGHAGPPTGGLLPTQAAVPERESTTDPLPVAPAPVPWLQRVIGLVVLLVAGTAATVLWLAVGRGVPEAQRPERTTLLGLWEVLYDTQMPTARVLLAAVALAVLLASGVALLEQRIAARSRRSADVRHDPLSPKNVMAGNRGRWAGPVTVTVLIPAHNEEASIGATIASLLAQSHPPERVVVVADNCTDGTVAVALAAGVEVIQSVGNTKKKAGALNQALRQVLPGQGDNDVVMVMDADTQLDDGFLEVAVARLTSDRALLAVGGLFYGEDGAGLIGQFQRNEYIRYSRELRRRRGHVFVLTGTASLFRPVALRTVAASRGTALPGTPGDVYDTAALTEDNELTLALKSLGALMISPQECTVVTEVMPTWRALWAQRLRWQRGALENLGAYGTTPRTFRYWAQQLGIGYGVIALASYFLLMGLTLLSSDGWIWFPFWMGLGAVFVVERVVTVWHGGWRARLLALSLFPELFFDAFLDVVFVKGVVDISLGRQADWKHVVHGAGGTGLAPTPAPVAAPAPTGTINQRAAGEPAREAVTPR